MDRRTAFTLLELLLSISLIAAIAAVVIPNITSMLGDQRLSRAAEQLQIEMTRLRIDAMRQGRVLMLEATVDANTLTTRPFFSISDAVETADRAGGVSSLMQGADQASAVVMPLPTDAEVETTIELPEAVVIESVQVVSSARSLTLAQQGGDPSVGSAGSQPTQAVWFYPDGTTSTAAIVLIHPEVGRITVQLRGITGEVTVGDMTVAEGIR
ncbi:hypothetical protein Pla52o_08580 [Novipirellula galeiformis]|uniref:General secretion pathway GspH domain-containing protein n=1 Tax=Novipirellula galeiformis TaxID=2528004 RepID=A0A5C6CRA5_9BACT|nr:prepilin-type cleavage/methylation domain-containing protein [Novipirellula galeiformis]TWU27002.1 hypothetical protein Pla52o_08580 [Novipirellula galeiformis]